jgi:hypothetical protein
MQRNMDLVRTILMRMENSTPAHDRPGFGILGFSQLEIGYHVYIMMQEGLIEGSDVTSTASAGVPQGLATRLTWNGHEFLDLVRDQERWNKAKAIIAKVGSAPISVWIKVLTDLLLQSVEAVVAKSS